MTSTTAIRVCPVCGETDNTEFWKARCDLAWRARHEGPEPKSVAKLTPNQRAALDVLRTKGGLIRRCKAAQGTTQRTYNTPTLEALVQAGLARWAYLTFESGQWTEARGRGVVLPGVVTTEGGSK